MLFFNRRMMIVMAQGTSEKTGKTATRKAAPSVEFEIHAPEAGEVFLVGDFNDWNSEDYRMRRFKDGSWKKKVKLKPGSYQYRFVVDGEWWTDPANPERQKNEFGSENSVITI
jgi:1,4-alpha-glucan branching enzyme